MGRPCPRHSFVYLLGDEPCHACVCEAAGKRVVDMSDWIVGVSPLPCVIIRAEIGIIYEQTVGGCYNLHQERIEGYIDEFTPLRAWYAEHHRAAMQGEHPYPLIEMWSQYSIYEDDQGPMFENLRKSDFDMELLDTKALADGWGEAWIPVKLPDGRRGVFTWQNSD